MKNKTAQTTLYRALASAGIVATLLLGAPARADDLADVSKLAKTGKAVEALKKANDYLAKHPADPQMRFMKGVLLTEQNRSEEAIAVFTKLTEDYRDLPEPYNNLAVLYAANGQYDKARVALERAIRTNPSYMTAYENLGDVYGKMASQAYDKALALGANNVPAKSNLTLLRTFSTSTGPKNGAPETAATALAAMPAAVAQAATTPARVAAGAQPPLISQISPDAGKTNAPQRIPALSVTPPVPNPAPAPASGAATKIASAAASVPVPAVVAKTAPAPAAVPAAPVKLAAVTAALPAPLPVPAKVAATPAPAAAKPAAPSPTPTPVVAKLEPAKPSAPPVVLAKAEPVKTAPVPTRMPTPVPVPAKPVVAAVQPEPPKPVKTEAPKPAKPDTTERDAVLAQVNGWAKAWTAQNVDSYLGYYSQEFEPPKGLSRKAWADERRARIEGKGRIHVAVGGPEVVVNGNTARVSFHQTYESDRLTARSRKTLVLVKNGGKWQIKQESSGS